MVMEPYFSSTSNTNLYDVEELRRLCGSRTLTFGGDRNSWHFAVVSSGRAAYDVSDHHSDQVGSVGIEVGHTQSDVA